MRRVRFSLVAGPFLIIGIARLCAAGGTGVSSVADVVDPENILQADTTKVFNVYRVPQLVSFHANRDIEFLWSQTYSNLGAPIVPPGSTDENDLDRLGVTVCTAPSNTFGLPMSDIRLSYDYLNLDNLSYNAGSGPGFLIRQPSEPYSDADRNHIDTYAYYPGPTGDGPALSNRAAHPSDFTWWTEDTDTGGLEALVRFRNSLSLAGPLASQVGDLGPNRWTRPNAAANVALVHEFQHAINQVTPNRGTSEILSLASEAITGFPDDPPRFDVPYTWNLFRSGSGCNDLSTSNYAAWASFAAYIAYNFRGVDTSSTGRADDLLWRWTHAPGEKRPVPALGFRLEDSECAECPSKTYFNGLSTNDRGQLLIHNWRVANYLNNPAIADSQFYFPPEFGYDPILDTGNWQNIDGGAPDAINIEREVLLTSAHATTDVSYAGTPTNVINPQNTHVMSLEHFGSDYWVVRSDQSLWSTNRDLVIRVAPEGECAVRLLVTAVAYTQQDSAGQAVKLWRHSEWAQLAVAAKWTDIHGTGQSAARGGDLETVIPNFGQTHKAALIVVTTGASEMTCGNTQVLPYRLTLALKGAPALTPIPYPLTSISDPFYGFMPTWAPTGDSLAFVAKPVGAGFALLHTRRLSGGPASLLVHPSQPHNQFHPDWSPRGDWVAFDQESTANNCDVLAYNTVTGQLRRLATTSQHEVWPAFSPNGQQLAFIRSLSPTGNELHIINLDGTNDLVVVVRTDASFASPRWSPDGRHVFFIAADSLYAVELDGREVISIPKVGSSIKSIDLPSGGGRPLAAENWLPLFCGSPSVVQRSCIVLRDTTSLVSQLAFWHSNSSFTDARWSMDGIRLAFASNFNRSGLDGDVFVGQVSYNRPPTFMGLEDQSLNPGVAFQLELLATESDGQSLTYVCPSTYWPPGASFDPGTRRFTWPNPQPPGSEHFVVFRALDPSGGVANKVVRLYVQGPAGSGCPFADTRTVEGWREENSVLGRSLGGSLALDAYRLRFAPEVIGGRVSLRLRENEQEYTTLDHVRLIAVDHAQEVQAHAVGERFFLATRVPAYRVVTSTGRDITTSVNGTGGYYWGSPGDTLLVEMTVGRSSGVFGGSGTQDGGGEGGMEGDPKETEKGGPTGPSSTPMDASAVDAEVLGSTGILVQVSDGGRAWRTLTQYYPRRYRDETIIDSLGSGPCRLIFVGRHRLHFIGRYQYAAATANPQELPLRAAMHSRLGSAGDAVAQRGGTTTALVPGDTLTMEFDSNAPPAGQARTHFMLATGAYSAVDPRAQGEEAVPENGPPSRFALVQNFPNPFDKLTTIRFELPIASVVTLEVFDLLGRRIALLADGSYPAGFHAAEWDRRDQGGTAVRPGVYLYRLKAGEFTDQRKMVLFR